jgi:hypothetical protein
VSALAVAHETAQSAAPVRSSAMIRVSTIDVRLLQFPGAYLLATDELARRLY